MDWEDPAVSVAPPEEATEAALKSKEAVGTEPVEGVVGAGAGAGAAVCGAGAVSPTETPEACAIGAGAAWVGAA